MFPIGYLSPCDGCDSTFKQTPATFTHILISSIQRYANWEPRISPAVICENSAWWPRCVIMHLVRFLQLTSGIFANSNKDKIFKMHMDYVLCEVGKAV